MTSDLAKLMEYIDKLQSEPTPEPVMEEVEETKVHPLLQAMQELKEEGIVDEYVNKDTVQPNFTAEKEIHNGYIVKATGLDSGKGLKVEVFDPKNPYKLFPIADATFKINPDDKTLTSSLTSVSHKYRKQGIARAMYQFVHDLGNDIQASNTLLPDGKRMWDAFKSQGTTFSNEPNEPEKPETKPEVKKSFWQRLFKEADAIDEEIAYHGTTDDITEFRPLTHFGTEKAAKDRMEYKKIKDGKIYKVDLNINNPLTIKDFPGIHYDRLYAFELKDKRLISQEEMEDITFTQDPKELRSKLLAKLKELGIDGFVYKNKYEDKGNISYVIVDPSQVKVLSVEPAAEEVTEASGNKVAYHVTPTQNLRSVMKNGLVPNIGGRSSKIAGEHSGIYLFPSVEAAEDAVMNWLGDEFDEDEPLTLLKVNIDGLEKYISQGADYELIVNTNIEPNRIHKLDTQLEEASPDTLEGSFTPDLVESKTWLAKMLAKGLKGKNAGTIYVLGSWYGNMGIFLQQAGVKFDKLVLVEPDEEALMRSKELLDILNDDGKLILIHQKAEDIVYEKPGVVINTSCNETGPVFLTKLPDNMLCLLQARNNNEHTLFPTEAMEDFIDYFPLEKVYYTGEKHLEDPEINYVRFMKIGRTGKKLDETISTGLGGGSAGSSGGQMVGGPTTYEQEYGMFKSKGPRRIMSMTEALDSSYPYEGKAISGRYSFETEDGVFYKVYFQGKDLVEIAFSAILPGEEENFRPDKTTITGTGNSRKVFGTVIKIVQDYVDAHEPKALYFIAGDEPSRIRLYQTMTDQVDKALPGYEAAKATDLGTGKAFMLKRKTKKVNEALDSSYPYEFKNNAYYFTTDAGTDYKVFFKGTDKVEVTFVAKGKHGQPKDNITGTGDSRKVFGTVINIVKDYISTHQPKILLFAADSSVPSRVKLYSMLASQASKELPGYSLANTLRNKLYTTFYLTKDNANIPKTDIAKNILHKTLDTVVGESTITLNKLYGDNKPHRDDTIWDYGTMIWDNQYPVETINPNKLNLYLQSQYRIEHYEELFDMMDEDQQEIVEKYVNDPNLSDKIIVLDNGYIVDGNHRALAAVIANKPIKYIDIGEEDEPS